MQQHVAREGMHQSIKDSAFPFAPDAIDQVVDVLGHPEQLERVRKAILCWDRNRLTFPGKNWNQFNFIRPCVI